MTRDDVLVVLEQWREAVDRRDMDAYRALYAEAARVESPLAGSVQGPDAIVESVRSFFRGFPDAVLTYEPAIVDGHRAALVGEVAGTHVGTMMGIAATGRSFRFRIAFVIAVNADHQIVEERRIYDFTGLLVQVGVLKAKPA
jgi:steroid delta-isomerase-like uncharacterized protein